MVFHSSSSLTPRRLQERHPTDLVFKTAVVNAANGTKSSRHRRTEHKHHDFFTVLQTIMENESEESWDAPITTTAAMDEKHEPMQKKSHRRSHATDWSEMSCVFEDDVSNDKQVQQLHRHRRSKALNEDEFTEILMLCDELHAPWAQPRAPHPSVWNLDAWKTYDSYENGL